MYQIDFNDFTLNEIFKILLDIILYIMNWEIPYQNGIIFNTLILFIILLHSLEQTVSQEISDNQHQNSDHSISLTLTIHLSGLLSLFDSPEYHLNTHFSLFYLVLIVLGSSYSVPSQYINSCCFQIHFQNGLCSDYLVVSIFLLLVSVYDIHLLLSTVSILFSKHNLCSLLYVHIESLSQMLLVLNTFWISAIVSIRSCLLLRSTFYSISISNDYININTKVYF